MRSSKRISWDWVLGSNCQGTNSCRALLRPKGGEGARCMGDGSAGWPGPQGSCPPEPVHIWSRSVGSRSHLNHGTNPGVHRATHWAQGQVIKVLLKKYQVHIEGVGVFSLPRGTRGGLPAPGAAWSGLGQAEHVDGLLQKQALNKGVPKSIPRRQ